MNKTIIGLIVAILIVGGVVLVMNQNKAQAPSDETNDTTSVDPTPSPSVTPDPTPSPTETPTPAPSPTSTAPKTVTISMTDSGFSPNTITINNGDTVKFVNNGTKGIWPASAPHPTHTDYPGFDAGKAVQPGGSYSFTFTKVGTWKYHNHSNSSQFGSITVQ